MVSVVWLHLYAALTFAVGMAIEAPRGRRLVNFFGGLAIGLILGIVLLAAGPLTLAEQVTEDLNEEEDRE